MYKTVENKKINEKYYFLKHGSGLDIFVFPKNHTTAFALLGAKYGSIDNIFKVGGEKDFTEVPDGIAHFLEHKLFENENGIHADELFADTGAYSNAYTGFDKTCYLFSCADNGEKFEESLEVLLNFVTSPYFTEESVEKEQGIIEQEIKMYDDDPYWQVYFQMLSNMYEKHSVRLDIAGTVESVSKITAGILYKCYNAFYNPGNMTLVVSGDITPEQVLKTADKVLAGCNAPGAPSIYQNIEIERFKYNEPKGVKKNIAEKKLKVSKPLFNIGIKDDETGICGKELAKKTAETDILINMMFSRSSDFYTRLYDQGKINNKFNADGEIQPEYAHWIFSGESDDPLEVRGEIIKEFESQIKNGLDREAFERCKRAGYAGSITVFDNTENIANAFISCIYKGYDILDVPEITGSITFEDIEKRLKQIFKKENFIISIINPI
jgi:predicted Zn-dependent peptidase